jgi:hypothetical protein
VVLSGLEHVPWTPQWKVAAAVDASLEGRRRHRSCQDVERKWQSIRKGGECCSRPFGSRMTGNHLLFASATPSTLAQTLHLVYATREQVSLDPMMDMPVRHGIKSAGARGASSNHQGQFQRSSTSHHDSLLTIYARYREATCKAVQLANPTALRYSVAPHPVRSPTS